MQTQLHQRKQKGFTIIEVLIVLAIAGLIMLIVFLAVPQLHRNARNNARNSEASRVSALITECLANRNGVTTSCDNATKISWASGDFQQFSSVTYSNTMGNTTDIHFNFGLKCSTDGSSTQAGTTRDFVVLYQREPAINRCIGSQ